MIHLCLITKDGLTDDPYHSAIYSAPVSMETLIHHATRLAPYTHRTPVAAQGSSAGTTTVTQPQRDVYYPIERLMVGSKLMRLAKGQVMSAGEVGDREVLGDESGRASITAGATTVEGVLQEEGRTGAGVDDREVNPVAAIQGQASSGPASTATTTAAAAADKEPPAAFQFKPINLDLSESEDEDDQEMEQVS